MNTRRLCKPLSHAKLVGLLSAERWETLAKEIGLPPETDKAAVRNNPGLISTCISRTRLLHEVLDERGPALAMFADIVDFLDVHGLAVRTTANVATLPGLDELKPQQRKILSHWNASARRRWKRDEEIETLWQEASAAMDRLLEESSDRKSGKWKRQWGPAAYNWAQPEQEYHEDVLELLRSQIKMIECSLPDPLDDPVLEDIANKCSALTSEASELAEGRPSGRRLMDDYQEEIDKVRMLVERIALTGDLQETEDGIAELLALAVFRHLPQLYEAWLLCFVLRTLEKAGYPITLKQVQTIDGRSVWNLQYAGASQPVACVGSRAWIFFQYKASDRAAMPDFAIFDNALASGNAMAVFDAKYSELHGYAMSDYVSTLEKYRSLGGRGLVLEYTDRKDLKQRPDVVFAVRPDSLGAERLKSELFRIFVTPEEPAFALIDRSTSFSTYLPDALRRILGCARSKRLQDRYILFGRTAELRSCLLNAIRSGEITTDGAGGTLIEPLRTILMKDLRSESQSLTLLLVSDSEFDDGSQDELRNAGDVVWTLGPHDLD